MKTNIIVKLQVEGIHNWPDCPIKEVAFLKDPHRHIFHIVCKKEVSHLDRDIEIIQLKRQIEVYLFSMYAIIADRPNTCLFGSQSCEMIATELFKKFDLNYCSVLEDNENGAEVTV